MDKLIVKTWIYDLLNIRFHVVDKSIDRLTFLDLFYIYAEIYKKYNVKLSAEALCKENLDIDLIVDYICKMGKIQ